MYDTSGNPGDDRGTGRFTAGTLFWVTGRRADAERVRIPREIVAWALSVVLASVAINHRRGGGAASQVGRREDRKEPASASASRTCSFRSRSDAVRRSRASTRRAARGWETRCRATTSSPRLGVLHDVPPERADLVAALEMIANTTKPLVVLVSREEVFEPVLDLLEACAAISRPPICHPVRQPGHAAGDQRRDERQAVQRDRPRPAGDLLQLRHGRRDHPHPPRRHLALLNAELLAGLVLAQLIREGAPVILGCLPASFDMQTMWTYYGPETMLINLACGEMMAHYGVPHCGTSGSGGGWGADLLAADGFWLNHLTACVGTVGLAPFVGGNFDSQAFSPAVVVLADVISAGAALRGRLRARRSGRRVGRDRQVGPGGNFLTAKWTPRHFRDAYFRSPIFPRLSLETWEAQGSPKAGEALRARTVELLAHARPPEDHPGVAGARRVADPGLAGRISSLRRTLSPSKGARGRVSWISP